MSCHVISCHITCPPSIISTASHHHQYSDYQEYTQEYAQESTMCQPLSHLFLIDSVESSLISPVSFGHLLFLIVSVVSSDIPSVTQCYSSPPCSFLIISVILPCSSRLVHQSVAYPHRHCSSTHLSLSLSLVMSCHITCPYHHH